MDMLADVLRKKAEVEEIRSFSALLRFLINRRLCSSSARILIYTSLMAPLIFVLKSIRPGLFVYYMVRGDEITYVKQRKRYIRVLIAFIFQKLLVIIGCRFVFVCEDLKVLFEKRLGLIRKSCVLPNTLGKRLPDSRPFDGRLALIGDFDTIKNIEWAIRNLSQGKFEVHLYGNTDLPERWQRPWLHYHGFVKELVPALRKSVSLVVLADSSAGFPNVVVDALEAGCGCVVHREFPFAHFPITENWRFSLHSSKNNSYSSSDEHESDLEAVLGRLLEEKRDFKSDNLDLIKLIESDWIQRVWEIFS